MRENIIEVPFKGFLGEDVRLVVYGGIREHDHLVVVVDGEILGEFHIGAPEPLLSFYPTQSRYNIRTLSAPLPIPRGIEEYIKTAER